ncbi:MAG: phosphate acetyltransferase [Halanaerobiaceae bacterium]
MNVMEKLREKVQKNKKKIVLPEGNDPRIVEAAGELIKLGYAEVIILGDKNKIREKSPEPELVEEMEVINPESSEYLAEFSDKFYELRKHKGLDREEAAGIISDPLYFGAMLVETGKAAGMVAGASTPTSNVLRPAFQVIKTAPGISLASGAFIMKVPDCNYGAEGLFVFADCAVNPSPDSNELAQIALSSARTAEQLLGIDPVVAMLSFSSKGSAITEEIEKVKKAVEIVQNKDSELVIDGELQADAALIPEIAKTKAPDSPVAGRANVLVFPGLEAGNIGYKLVQRLAGAEAFGPLLQGIARPVNDLSRGCSVKDIINVAVLTSAQA